jgi:hypothetical protein
MVPIELEKKDVVNTQQMEVAVNGPDGATHLILCTGVANLDSVAHNTYTFLVGPQLSRRQFVGVIASGAISTIQTQNKKPIRNATILNLEADIVFMNAQFDEESGQVKLTAEVSCNTSMTKLAISYNVTILAELHVY